jgi:hypothetical protein
MELPKTIKEVQSHLGLFQFFCELIENYALIAAPLSAVTSPSHPWKSFKISGHLPKEAQEAWHKLIDIISSRPAIAFPDFSLPFQLHVEAAVGQDHHNPPIRGGLGAILTQVQDGFTRPIGYYSRQFRESECKYNAYNAELAGIVASLNHFYQYLKGSKTTIFTDHLPIMKKSKQDTSTMDALTHKMNDMEIDLIHIKGNEMPADALSRQPLIETAKQAREDIRGIKLTSSTVIDSAFPITMSDKQWKFEQEQDTTCREIKAYIKTNRPSIVPEIRNMIHLYGYRSIIDQGNGLLYLFTSRAKHMASKRIWVPTKLVAMVMANNHGSTLTGHKGEAGTYELVATSYFWPSMAQDISDFVRRCKSCHQQRDSNATKDKAPLRPWATPSHRNMRIHMDLVGPLKSSEGFNHILTITDALRKFKVGDQVLLHLPTPPPGNNKKFYSPWRGIYTVIERTSDLTYKVRKKGGRVRDTHINRLKYYDPENSSNDEKVHLSNNEDLGTHDTTQTEDTTQTGDT